MLHKAVRMFHYPALLVGLLSAVAAAPPEVQNHKTGSTVRYPVVLLRGRINKDQRQLTIVNPRLAESAPQIRPVVHEGRFKALVPLREGENTIVLTAADEQSTLELSYVPQTNPFYVRLVWMTDKTGNTKFATPSDDVPQDYEARLRTAAQLMQTFTAERMHDLGFGRRTFRLERDAAGQIIVHTFAGPETAEFYYELGDSNGWWRNVYRWLNAEHPDPFAKNIVLAAYTRKDADTGKLRGHTALGGGNLGLFGSASVFAWPRDVSTALDVFGDDTRVDGTRVHDDSAGRSTYWGLASTTIGATLHEMGHTFGLPHCKDGLGIMTRGFDRFNRVFMLAEPPSGQNRQTRYFTPEQEAYFAPISAAFLQWSRWFQLDETTYEDNAAPRIRVTDESVVVTAASGVRWVGFWVGGDVVAYREFDGADATEVTVSREEIGKLLRGQPLSTVTAMSASGRDGRQRADR